MPSFFEHPGFQKDIKRLERKRYSISPALDSFKRICYKQFHPENPEPVIGPGKIHRLHDFGVYEVWKVELHGKGLRKNQGPRIWFARRGTHILFLSAASHVDNYNDNQVDAIAVSRVSDFF